MAIYIRMTGPDAEDELRSLRDWLRDEPEVQHNARVALQSAEPQPGEMGAIHDAIQVLTDEGFNTAELILAFLAWRATRARKPESTIERGAVQRRLPDKASHEEVEEISEALDDEQP